jgi:hypothetical protein
LADRATSASAGALSSSVVGEVWCQGVGTAAVSSRSTVCGRRPSSRAAK